MTVSVRFRKQEIPGFDEYMELLDSLEPRVLRAFTDALSEVEIEFALVRDLFEQGNIEALLRLLGFDAFERRFMNLVTPELDEIAARGQRFAADRLGRETTLPSVDWKVLSEDVLVALRTQSVQLVSGISDDAQKAVRRFLLTAYEEGRGSRAVASQIGNVVGLTERQAVAVSNFTRGLDEVYDGLVPESAFRRRYRLSPKVAGRREKIVREYVRRQVRHRGEMIARTETITAFTRGRNAAWQRMKDTGAIPPTAVQEWISSPDERTCPICIPLHGEQAPVGGSFPGGFAGPPAHVMCRCDTRVVLNPANVRRSEGRQRADRFIETREAELTGR